MRVYAVVSEQMSDEALELFVDRQIAEPDEGVENWDPAALPLAFSDTAPPGAWTLSLRSFQVHRALRAGYLTCGWACGARRDNGRSPTTFDVLSHG